MPAEGQGAPPQVVAFRPSSTLPPFTLGTNGPDGTVAIMGLSGQRIGVGRFDGQGTALHITLANGTEGTADVLFRGMLDPDGTVTLVDGQGHPIGTGTVLAGTHSLEVRLADGGTRTIDLGGSTIEASRGAEQLTFSVGGDGTLRLSSMSAVSDGKLTIPMAAMAGVVVPAGVVATFTATGHVLLNGQAVTQRQTGSGSTSSTVTSVADDPLIHLKDGRWMHLSEYLKLLNAAGAQFSNDHSEKSYLAWLSLLAQYDQAGPDATVNLNGQSTSLQGLVQGQLQQASAAEKKYIGQVTYDVGQMFSFRDVLWAQSGTALSAMSTLQANLSGLDAALGDDQYADNFRKGWDNTTGTRFCDVWQTLQEQITVLSNGYSQVGVGMHQGATQLLASEEANVQNFGVAVGNPGGWQVPDPWHQHPLSAGQLRLIQANQAAPAFTELAVPNGYQVYGNQGTLGSSIGSSLPNGDAAAIRGYAQTLNNAATTFRDIAAVCDSAFESCITDWTGSSADDFKNMWFTYFAASSYHMAVSQKSVVPAISGNLYALSAMLQSYATSIEQDRVQILEVTAFATALGVSLAFAAFLPQIVGPLTEAAAAFALTQAAWSPLEVAVFPQLVTGAALIVGGAVTGAGISGSFSGLQQVVLDGGVDWGKVGHDAATGAIVGGIASLFLVGAAPLLGLITNGVFRVTTTALTAGVGTFVGDLAAQKLLDPSVNVVQALEDAGAATALVGLIGAAEVALKAPTVSSAASGGVDPVVASEGGTVPWSSPTTGPLMSGDELSPSVLGAPDAAGPVPTEPISAVRLGSSVTWADAQTETVPLEGANVGRGDAALARPTTLVLPDGSVVELEAGTPVRMRPFEGGRNFYIADLPATDASPAAEAPVEPPRAPVPSPSRDPFGRTMYYPDTGGGSGWGGGGQPVLVADPPVASERPTIAAVSPEESAAADALRVQAINPEESAAADDLRIRQLLATSGPDTGPLTGATGPVLPITPPAPTSFVLPAAAAAVVGGLAPTFNAGTPQTGSQPQRTVPSQVPGPVTWMPKPQASVTAPVGLVTPPVGAQVPRPMGAQVSAPLGAWVPTPSMPAPAPHQPAPQERPAGPPSEVPSPRTTVPPLPQVEVSSALPTEAPAPSRASMVPGAQGSVETRFPHEFQPWPASPQQETPARPVVVSVDPPDHGTIDVVDQETGEVQFRGVLADDGTLQVFGADGTHLGEGELVDRRGEQVAAIGLDDDALGGAWAGPVELRISGEAGTESVALEGRLLQMIGRDRVALFEVTDGGARLRQVESFRDGDLVLKTPEGELRLPRQSIVSFENETTAWVTALDESGKTDVTAMFSVEDGTYTLVAGPIQVRPEPDVPAGPPEGTVVDADPAPQAPPRQPPATSNGSWTGGSGVMMPGGRVMKFLAPDTGGGVPGDGQAQPHQQFQQQQPAPTLESAIGDLAQQGAGTATVIVPAAGTSFAVTIEVRPYRGRPTDLRVDVRIAPQKKARYAAAVPAIQNQVDSAFRSAFAGQAGVGGLDVNYHWNLKALVPEWEVHQPLQAPPTPPELITLTSPPAGQAAATAPVSERIVVSGSVLDAVATSWHSAWRAGLLGLRLPWLSPGNNMPVTARMLARLLSMNEEGVQASLMDLSDRPASGRPAGYVPRLLLRALASPRWGAMNSRWAFAYRRGNLLSVVTLDSGARYLVLNATRPSTKFTYTGPNLGQRPRASYDIPGLPHPPEMVIPLGGGFALVISHGMNIAPYIQTGQFQQWIKQGQGSFSRAWKLEGPGPETLGPFRRQGTWAEVPGSPASVSFMGAAINAYAYGATLMWGPVALASLSAAAGAWIESETATTASPSSIVEGLYPPFQRRQEVAAHPFFGVFFEPFQFTGDIARYLVAALPELYALGGLIPGFSRALDGISATVGQWLQWDAFHPTLGATVELDNVKLWRPRPRTSPTSPQPPEPAPTATPTAQPGPPEPPPAPPPNPPAASNGAWSGGSGVMLPGGRVMKFLAPDTGGTAGGGSQRSQQSQQQFQQPAPAPAPSPPAGPANAASTNMHEAIRLLDAGRSATGEAGPVFLQIEVGGQQFAIRVELAYSGNVAHGRLTVDPLVDRRATLSMADLHPMVEDLSAILGDRGYHQAHIELIGPYGPPGRPRMRLEFRRDLTPAWGRDVRNAIDTALSQRQPAQVIVPSAGQAVDLALSVEAPAPHSLRVRIDAGPGQGPAGMTAAQLAEVRRVIDVAAKAAHARELQIIVGPIPGRGNVEVVGSVVQLVAEKSLAQRLFHWETVLEARGRPFLTRPVTTQDEMRVWDLLSRGTITHQGRARLYAWDIWMGGTGPHLVAMKDVKSIVWLGWMRQIEVRGADGTVAKLLVLDDIEEIHKQISHVHDVGAITIVTPRQLPFDLRFTARVREWPRTEQHHKQVGAKVIVGGSMRMPDGRRVSFGSPRSTLLGAAGAPGLYDKRPLWIPPDHVEVEHVVRNNADIGVTPSIGIPIPGTDRGINFSPFSLRFEAFPNEHGELEFHWAPAAFAAITPVSRMPYTIPGFGEPGWQVVPAVADGRYLVVRRWGKGGDYTVKLTPGSFWHRFWSRFIPSPPTPPSNPPAEGQSPAAPASALDDSPGGGEWTNAMVTRGPTLRMGTWKDAPQPFLAPLDAQTGGTPGGRRASSQVGPKEMAAAFRDAGQALQSQQPDLAYLDRLISKLADLRNAPVWLVGPAQRAKAQELEGKLRTLALAEALRGAREALQRQEPDPKYLDRLASELARARAGASSMASSGPQRTEAVELERRLRALANRQRFEPAPPPAPAPRAVLKAPELIVEGDPGAIVPWWPERVLPKALESLLARGGGRGANAPLREAEVALLRRFFDPAQATELNYFNGRPALRNGQPWTKGAPFEIAGLLKRVPVAPGSGPGDGDGTWEPKGPMVNVLNQQVSVWPRLMHVRLDDGTTAWFSLLDHLREESTLTDWTQPFAIPVGISWNDAISLSAQVRWQWSRKRTNDYRYYGAKVILGGVVIEPTGRRYRVGPTYLPPERILQQYSHNESWQFAFGFHLSVLGWEALAGGKVKLTPVAVPDDPTFPEGGTHLEYVVSPSFQLLVPQAAGVQTPADQDFGLIADAGDAPWPISAPAVDLGHGFKLFPPTLNPVKDGKFSAPAIWFVNGRDENGYPIVKPWGRLDTRRGIWRSPWARRALGVLASRAVPEAQAANEALVATISEARQALLDESLNAEYVDSLADKLWWLMEEGPRVGPDQFAQAEELLEQLGGEAWRRAHDLPLRALPAAPPAPAPLRNPALRGVAGDLARMLGETAMVLRPGVGADEVRRQAARLEGQADELDSLVEAIEQLEAEAESPASSVAEAREQAGAARAYATRLREAAGLTALHQLLEEAKAAGIEIRADEEAQRLLDWGARVKGADPKNYHAVTLGDCIFVRPEYAESVRVLREELIHVFQQRAGIASNEVVEGEVQARLTMIASRHRWSITNDEVREMIREVRQMRSTGRY